MDQKTEVTEISLEPNRLSAQPRGQDRLKRNLSFVTNKLAAPLLFSLGALFGYIDGQAIRNYYIPPVVQASSNQTPTSSEVKVEEETPQPPINTEDRFFKNFSPEEKGIIEQAIAKQIKLYQTVNDPQRAERVLDWEKSTIKSILDLDVTPKDHQFWSEFLSAIVYVESEGKPQAKSEAGIVGLAQISNATAQETAGKHGINHFDLKKGWDSLRLGRFHLEDLIQKYGVDISLLAYYAGQSFTDQKILTADQLRLNVANLGSADGKEYFIKTVAAMRILREVRTG